MIRLLHKDTLVDTDYTHIVRHDINNVTFKSKFEAKDRFVLHDHAPYVFEEIRKLIGIDHASYQRSLGPESILVCSTHYRPIFYSATYIPSQSWESKEAAALYSF